MTAAPRAAARHAPVISGIDHVQIAVPPDGEAQCRAFYLGLLGLAEMPRPASGAGRSFLWVRAGDQEIHFRPDPEFSAGRFAHSALVVSDTEALAGVLTAAGYEVSRAEAVGPRRFHTRDPFGNRLEFIEPGR